MNQHGRVYGGRSESERRADRRDRLLQAGLELFGTEGWQGTTIERLCSTAGVATRSFYEEFASREALLHAVYESVLTGVLAELLPRVRALRGSPREQIRIGLSGYLDYLTSDPRRARVVHREIRMAGELEAHRRAMMVRVADLIAEHGRLPQETGRLIGLALAGGVSEVLVDWVSHTEPRPDPAPLAEVLVGLYSAVLLRS